jgi:hypothetical protein
MDFQRISQRGGIFQSVKQELSLLRFACPVGYRPGGDPVLLSLLSYDIGNLYYHIIGLLSEPSQCFK